MTSAEIRQQFIEFFEGKGHSFVRSSPVIPADDPTLLFINAGMNQFKDVFLGSGSRPYSRAVNSQKCIRAGGKHNDLEEVGPSPNHHTFFEMLGNWSFGDYYKAEAIRWAWELVTEVYGLDKDRLYATVFTDDDEAAELWASETDIDPAHISRHGHKDNYWEMGVPGPTKEQIKYKKGGFPEGPYPCGPCTEIHYDLGKPAPGRDPIENDGPNTESGRYIEIWNLVFIQDQKEWIRKHPEVTDPEDPRYFEGDIKQTKLEKQHVDTGAGLERIARLLQGVESNYETDLFAPILAEIATRTGVPYVPPEKHGAELQYIPHRAISDHLRMAAFSIADGAIPGANGRDSVLRSVLRRAIRFLNKLNKLRESERELAEAKTEDAERMNPDLYGPDLTLVELVPVLIHIMGGHFSEIKDRQKHIETVIRAEEDSFGSTVEKGSSIFNDRYEKAAVEHVRNWVGDQLGKSGVDDFIEAAKQQHTRTSSMVKRMASAVETIYLNEVLGKNVAFEGEETGTLLRITKFILSTKFLFVKDVEVLEDERKELLLGHISALEDRLGSIRLSGKVAFELHDTYGFPLDLTEQMARERGIGVDVEGFHEEMEKAKERSRAGSAFKMEGGEFELISEGPHSEFIGYDELETATELRAVKPLAPEKEAKKDAPERVAVILAATPFYAESGGQVADHGSITGEGLELRVVDVRQEGDRRLHIAEVVRKPDGWPGSVVASVDRGRRRRILPHHTTTHLLQAALRAELGEHVTQAGSRVGPDSMTFDFTHPEKVGEESLRRVEAMVNAGIREDHPVSAELMSIDKAKEMGAMALFGEKYGDTVRVISIGQGDEVVSRELCGGTHMNRTGEAGMFRIEAESAVSAGVRRVECTAGEAAWQRAASEREAYERVQDLVGSRGSDPAEKLEKFFAERKALEKEIERLKKAALEGAVDFLADWGEAIEVKGEEALLVAGVYEVAGDRDALQAAADKIVADLGKADKEGIGVVGNDIGGSFMFVAVVTPGLVKQGVSAGKLVGHVAKAAGGGGGGKPDFATAGSKNIDQAQTILRDKPQLRKLVEEYLDSL